MNESTNEQHSSISTTDHWHQLLVSIAVAGVVANCTLLWRRSSTSKKSSSTTKTSLFLLSAMAAADTICLLSLLFMLTQRYVQIRNPFFLNMVCKMNLFILHATSAFSIWCWLVLSAVRYVAVYLPYTHLRLNKEPHFAVVALAGFCGFMEIWVLYDSQFDPVSNSCTGSSSESLSKKLQITEIIASYFLPVAIITALDLKVLFCRGVWYRGTLRTTATSSSVTSNDRSHLTRHISMDETIRGGDPIDKFSLGSFEPDRLSKLPVQPTVVRTRSKKRLQQLRVLRRCLCITIFDLSMNLPNYLLRLYLTIISDEEFESLDMEAILFVENISQVLYFAQFALNAVYLVCIIYDAPKSRTNTPLSLQVSTTISPRYTTDRRSFRYSDAGALI